MNATFGFYVKNLRLDRRMTLRGFCAVIEMDPANYSKLERGILPPPREPEKLALFERALGLASDSPESRELRRLAALDRGEVPAAVLGDRELVGKLPALFRTLEGDPIDEEVLDDLIATLRRE